MGRFTPQINMPPLSDLDDLEYHYSTDENIKDNVFIPAMKRATSVDRAIGYFTSQGLWQVKQGLEHLIKNGGKMRIITSHDLNQDDINLISHAYEVDSPAPSLVEESLQTKLIEFQKEHECKESLALLGYMIATDRLEIKIAIPKTLGIYHEKGVYFRDEDNNLLCGTGSGNETHGGHLTNFEGYSFHWTWGRFSGDEWHRKMVEKMPEKFEKKWNHESDSLYVYKFPEAVTKNIFKIAEESPEVFEKYDLPLPDNWPSKDQNTPFPRGYQAKSVNAWLNNKNKGLFEMATGTGKTYTGLFAVSAAMHGLKGGEATAEEISKTVQGNQDKKGVAMFVLAPYLHMIEDWKKDCEKFGFNVFSTIDNNWQERMKFLGNSCSNKPTAFIVLYETFRSKANQNLFKRSIKQVKENTGVSILLADEVHNLGAKEQLKNDLSYFDYRLGLSATPQRRDVEGTEHILNQIGPVLEDATFTLKQAIDGIVDEVTGKRITFLCPYNYYIESCGFTDEEQEDYDDLATRISNAVAGSKNKKKIISNENEDSALGRLFGERNRLIGRAENKISLLKKSLYKLKNNLGKEEFKHILIYCPENEDVYSEIKKIVLELGCEIAEILGESPLKERRVTLKLFGKGEIPILLAKKCLNEGINIPQAKYAYIMQSTANEMEYIQRRGRVLRKHEGKERAYITDYLVLPPARFSGHGPSSTLNLVNRELLRAQEFAECAYNAGVAESAINKIREKYR